MNSTADWPGSASLRRVLFAVLAILALGAGALQGAPRKEARNLQNAGQFAEDRRPFAVISRRAGKKRPRREGGVGRLLVCGGESL